MSRLDSCKFYVEKWIYADYEVDKLPVGYLSTNKYANRSRLVSLIDIPVQLIKPIAAITAPPVTIVCKITSGVAALIIYLPLKGVSALTRAQYLKNKSIAVLEFGKMNLKEGTISAALFCIAAPFLYPLVVPALLIYAIFRVVSDTLGLFFPEIGRFARYEIGQSFNRGEKWYAWSFKKTTTQETTQEALNYFGLGKNATLKDLDKKYKELVLQHPDKKKKDQDETTPIDGDLITKYKNHLKSVLPEGKAKTKPVDPSPPPPSETMFRVD